MFRKTLLLGAAVVVAIILIAPLILSYQIDGLRQAYVERLSREPLIRVEKSSFSRGWFESSSSLVLAPSVQLCSDPGCPHAVVNSRIYHGPLAFGAYAQTGIPIRPVQGIAVSHVGLDTQDSGISFDPALPSLVATTMVGLGGDQTVEIFWPGGSTHIQGMGKGAKLDAKPVQGKLVRDAGNNHLNVGLNAPGATLQLPNRGSMTLSDLDFSAERDLGDEGSGKYSLSLGQTTLTPPGDQPTLQLDKLALQSKTKREDGLASVSGDLKFSHFSAPSGSYGPGMLQFTADHLAYRVLQRIQVSAQQMSADRSNPALLSIALLQLYQENAGALLRPGPSLAIPQFQVTTPSGKVSGALHVSVPPDKAGDNPSVMLLIKLIQADFSIKAPRSLVAALIRARIRSENGGNAPSSGSTDSSAVSDAAIDQLIKKNILVPQGDGSELGFGIVMRNGDIYVNGQKSLNLGAMIGLFKSHPLQ